MTVSTPPPSVEELRALEGAAIIDHPLPWVAVDSDGEADEFYGCWYDLGPISIPGTGPGAQERYMLAAANALPGLLASTAKDKARIVELRDGLEEAQRYILHCGANWTEKGHPHPQQALVNRMTALLSPISEGEG